MLFFSKSSNFFYNFSWLEQFKKKIDYRFNSNYILPNPLKIRSNNHISITFRVYVAPICILFLEKINARKIVRYCILLYIFKYLCICRPVCTVYIYLYIYTENNSLWCRHPTKLHLLSYTCHFLFIHCCGYTALLLRHYCVTSPSTAIGQTEEKSQSVREKKLNFKIIKKMWVIAAMFTQTDGQVSFFCLWYQNKRF